MEGDVSGVAGGDGFLAGFEFVAGDDVFTLASFADVPYRDAVSPPELT